MSLPPGTRLGPYEIVAPLGAGGMGEVYRARDVRLDRAVAIKILHSHLSGSVELRQRFEREARAISSLSHPHICALYDVGHQDGVDYLVMEYLEGETLAERLRKGAVPTEQVLRTVIEITDALDKAHRQGVIHRDLKPGNIMLTKAGAKLLDFGLAKLRAPDRPGAILGSSALPTQRADLTAEGSIVGTLQYLSPEQLEGKEADARTDIFALGAVLYEMATGRKAFEGKSRASVIAAILERDPAPISTVQPMIPRALDRVVQACLAKDPEQRWQSAHDLVLELRWIAGGGSQGEFPEAGPRQRRGRERLAWAVAAASLMGVLATLPPAITHLRTPAAEPQPMRFHIVPTDGEVFNNSLALSPDGRTLAYVATRDGRSSLWVRPLDALEARLLSGTEGASLPFWSPDSRSIAFFAEGKLMRVDLSGGPPQTICEASDGRGGTWDREGIIVFSPSFQDPLHRVPASGGSPVPVTALDKSTHETSHRWPEFLPDGRHFLFVTRSGQRESQALEIGSLDSNERRRLFPTGSRVLYAPPGYLLFVREGTLMAQPFDPARLHVTGEAMAIAHGVESVGEAGPTLYIPASAASNRILAYRAETSANAQLTWFDRQGRPLGTAGPPGQRDEPTLSPDGNRVAMGAGDPASGTPDVWLLDLTRGTFSRFTFHPGPDVTPIWSPDGAQILFASNRAGSFDLYLKPSSGAADETLLLQSQYDKFPDDWSRDGRFIIYESLDPDGKLDLWVLPLSGDRKPWPLLKTSFREFHAQFSPDGRWVAYTSDESGRPEIYVRSFPEPGGKWQISTSGGGHASWRRDGKELYYVSTDDKLMAIPVRTAPVFEAGTPEELFATRPSISGFTYSKNHYVVTADGQRVLANTFSQESTSSPITVVVNWTEDLKP